MREDICIYITQLHKQEPSVIIETSGVYVLGGGGAGMSWEKYIFKLTSKTFLKADHFQINNEKNLTDQREKFVNYLCH